MKITEIESFLVVAQEKNLTRAAQKLYVSEPSVSHRINELEKELGCQLFQRNPRGVQLTEAGTRFYSYATQALALLREGVSELSKDDGNTARPLVIATVPIWGVYYLPLFIEYLASKQPLSQFHIKTYGYSTEIVNAVQNDWASIGLLNSNLAFILPGLAKQDLARDTSVLVAAPNHPIATMQKPLRIKEVTQFDMIALAHHSSYWKAIKNKFISTSTRPRIVIEADNIEFIKSLLIQQVGIAVLPMMCVSKEIAHGELAEIPTRPRISGVRTLSVVYRRSKHVEESILKFVQHLASFSLQFGRNATR